MKIKDIPYCSFVLLCILLLGCSTTKKTTTTVGQFVPFNDRHIQYEGRVGMTAESAELYWSGTVVRISFEGTGVKAVLQDYNGQNYYNVIIDGGNIHRIKADAVKQTYILADDLPAGKHTIELFKRTQIHQEYKRGYTKLYGFELTDGGKLVAPPPLKKRKMEFYGNSITCGHAIEDTTGGDSGASIYENNYLAYGAVTARHYNAQYHCISKSGIGMMVSFGSLIMPEMYNLLNPFDSTRVWDFSRYTPDLVVVNLFTNDAGIVTRPEYEQFKRRFGNKAPTETFIIGSYRAFIQRIRNHYPKAHIICTLGSMGSVQEGSAWPGYIEKAVAELHDHKVYTHFFRYKGSAGHPGVKDQAVMAESLIRFIDTTIKW